MRKSLRAVLGAGIGKDARSRVTNGAAILPGVDGRSVVGRRYRDIASAIVQDMGGLDRCSEARIQLIRRFAACATVAEQMEARLANGEPIDVAQHALLCSTLVRITSRIGLSRVPKNITPNLDDYLQRYSSMTDDLVDEEDREAVE